MKVRWNLNYDMTVYLTPTGKRIWDACRNGHFATEEGVTSGGVPYVTMCGWQLLKIFGMSLGYGHEEPFSFDVILQGAERSNG